MKYPIALIVMLLASFSFSVSQASADNAKPKPLRVLVITGGCCHDYTHQAKRFQEVAAKITNIQWTIEQDPRKGTEGEIDLYSKPDWGKDFDVVIHNECFANTSRPEYIRSITDAHKAGLPAVVIHCAMHTYRAAKIDDWREFLGVSSFMHEHQSNYEVTVTKKDHPIMKGFPADYKTPKDELYVLQKVWPNTTILATSKSEKNGKEHGVFWTNQFGKGRVFGTTYGHSNETWDDEVFVSTLVRGLLWSADKLDDNGKPAKGYEPDPKAASATSEKATDWSHQVAAKLGDGEKPVSLFNGKDLAGWEGLKDRWTVEEGVIVGRNNDKVPTSTYLFTTTSYRDFRLLLEVKQTRSPKHNTMHSAVCVLGEKFDDKGNAFGFKGPLLMFCNDWGIWDAYRRNRVEPANHGGQFHPEGVEKVGEWNQIEVLVIGNRIRFAANGKLVFDYKELHPELLKTSPIGLQLHANNQPQEFMFRGLVLSEKPGDELVTVGK